MAITGYLGTSDSILGNIQFGGGPSAGTVLSIFNLSVSESITFFETASKVTYFSRDITQSLTLSELAEVRLPMVFDLNISETLTLNQTLPKNISTNRNIDQTMPITETVVRGASRRRNVTESLFLNQVATGNKAKQRDVSESLDFEETLGFFRVVNLSITEHLIIVETATRASTYIRNISETLPLRGGIVRATRMGDGQYAINEAEIVKVTKKCFVLLESSNSAILLPCPNMGDTEKSMQQQIIKRSMNNDLIVYVRRNDLRQLSYTFIIGRGKCLDLQDFVESNIDKVMTMTNWKGEIWKVQITNNPIEFTSQSRFENEGEKWQTTLEFQGVKVLG